jgi:hypothetical protein
MPKKLTMTLDAQVYAGLHGVVGRRRISRSIEALVPPHGLAHDLDAGSQQMAHDEGREAEALEWSEATVRDVDDAPRGGVVGKRGPVSGRREAQEASSRHPQEQRRH